MSAALSMLATHMRIGSVCLERHLFADIHLDTIDVLQTVVEQATCRPPTHQEILDLCFVENTAKQPKPTYSGVLMSVSRRMLALHKASLNEELDKLPGITSKLRECVLKLARQMEDCERSRMKFAQVLPEQLENRAVRAMLQTLLSGS